MRPNESFLAPQALHAFHEEARGAVYDAIALRRDVRHFRTDLDVEEAVLERILGAAHRAPSVGFSQPWGFVVVRSAVTRGRIRDSFLRCREAESARFPAARREAYLAHKLEGILEAPVNLCVAVDLRSRGEAILGTTVQPEAVRASACCAVQNLWLAARAEGIGVGWVSIVEPAVLRAELGLPAGVEPIAYLCVGHARAFRERPMLEETGWLSRKPLTEVLHPDGVWVEQGEPVPSPSKREEHEPTIGVVEPDDAARRASAARQASLAKPVGSLGRLEELSAWYAAARGTYPPRPVGNAVLALFAADHGVVVEGVSAYGSATTAAVVANVMAGGAAINLLAGSMGVSISLVDVGISGDLSLAPTDPVVPLANRKIRAGTTNLRRGPAMTLGEVERAMEAGAVTAQGAIADGADLLGIGEIGIGNTTAAAALAAACTGAPPSSVVGRGTGIGEEVRARKIRVVEDALALHGGEASPLETLARFGGFELAAMVGCILEAARRRVPVALDGFVTCAAALIAVRMEPRARGYLLAAHLSPEPGARVILDELELRPLLELEMRLGEGTGAVLAMNLVRAAVRLEQSMATFATAGIVGRAGTDLGAVP